MSLSVTSEIEIARPLALVSSYSADPDNAPTWYVNIRTVDWQTPRPACVGSKVAFVAQFLGRTMSYTYEIVALEPNVKMVMKTAEGPFPMKTTYTWKSTESGHTCMTLTNSGEPAGFSKIGAPLVAAAMRHANRKDLLLLKKILEAMPCEGQAS